MTDRETILMFEKYMREKEIEDDTIQYNLKVVRTLSQEVLKYFNEKLESIDTYTFEEFTDMVGIIDSEFGGREGIAKIMNAMLLLTDFLKENKLIKGGKIAHYKRMFSDTKYYEDKYDMITGKKDDSKEFIKAATCNRFSSRVIKVVEDVNVYDFRTLDLVDKILNDVPLEKEDFKDEVPMIISILMDVDLLEVKNGVLEATKKGRGISRLSAEDRYGAILYLLFYCVDWNKIINSYSKEENTLNFDDILNILASIYHRERESFIELKSINTLRNDDIILELASEKFRIARIESLSYGRKIMDICFRGMGLIDISRGSPERLVYRANEFSQEIFKAVFEESAAYIKERIRSIGYMIKNKNYDLAEKNILDYLAVYGGNPVVWDYLGQLQMLKGNFKLAYIILKHGYEGSSKRGKASKSLLYHLVLCCRRLKYKEDLEEYQEKLQSMERA